MDGAVASPFDRAGPPADLQFLLISRKQSLTACAVSFHLSIGTKEEPIDHDEEETMKHILLSAVMLCAVPAAASAETWIAICTDGQNLQYNQTVGGNGFLYLKGKNQPSGGLQIARLQQTFYNGTAICGTVPGNGTGSAATGGHPITQLCANRSRNIIYILYKHPYEDRPFEDTVYCDARVDVR